MSGTDFVGEATTELYGSDPEGFTERRSALAAEARAAGDRSAAKEISGLRKPTRPAWMINQLLRADPGVADHLVQLGDELRAAAAALDGTKIRELSQARRRLVDTLIRQTLQQAGEEAPSAALREDLTATFGAAVADPQVARELAAGTLLRPVHRADFSPGLPGLALVPPPAKASGEAAETAAVPHRARAAGEARTVQPGKVADRPRVAEGAKPTGKARAAEEARAAREAKAAAEAKAAEEARAAERARAAEERRRVIADAEQVAAEARRAADQAAQDERDEQDKVWGLEDQLDEARRRLTATRRRVRETQNAQQKARRALSRLKDTGR